MMGPRQIEQGVLFYNFSLDAHVPADHLLRSIDRFVELSELRRELAPFYSSLGRPSVAPELMIRMLIIGYWHPLRAAPVRGSPSQSGVPVVLPARA
jgi:transposase